MKLTSYRIENNNVLVGNKIVAKCHSERDCLEAIYIIDGSNKEAWFVSDEDGNVYETERELE